MKVFSKKAEGNSLRTLNEQEIQKRLYGRYHRDSTSSIKGLVTNTVPHQVKVAAPQNSFSFSNWLKESVFGTRGLLRQFLQRVPWKFAAIVTTALIIAIVVLQMISLWIGKLKMTSGAKNVNPAVEVQVTQEALEKEMVSVQAKPPVASISSPLSKVDVSKAPKRKYYAIQVCTYQREQDARQLTQELKSINFPAFYTRILSLQQKTPHYVVFLGKEETYQAANAKLSEFRKTQTFQRFSDSFIRSI